MVIRLGYQRDYLKTTGNEGIEYLDTFWDDLRVPVSATRKPASGLDIPTVKLFRDNGAGSTGVWCDAFDPSTEQSVLFEVQIPHKYKQGTSLHCHVHWAKADGGTGNVSWGVEYSFAELADTFPNTVIFDNNIPAIGSGGDHEHCLTPITEISMAGVSSVSSMIVARVFRNATDATDDTYAGDAFLLEVDFHIQIDRPGSRDEYIK